MRYLLPTLRSELANQTASILGVDSAVVEDANPIFGADLAIPCHTYSKKLQQSPNNIAEQLAGSLKHELIEKTEATAGFVNVWLNPQKFAEAVLRDARSHTDYGTSDTYANQTLLVEFTDPNPFKPLHIGHLYSNTVGESIARLMETAGASAVHRVSYHGDVGVHIAKALWGMRSVLEGKPLNSIAASEQAAFLGMAYAAGARAYEQDTTIKEEIDALNAHIYAKDDPDLNAMYATGRQWSFDYFDSIYRRVGVVFEKQYFESDTGPQGAAVVRNYIGDVFEESDGAVIFRGERYGLHTRVFINSQGLPTYEAKDLALAIQKDEDYHYDRSIIITAHEQAAYFAVMLKALEQIKPELAAKTLHIAHGEIRLPSGKMSSRTGDIVTAEDLLDSVEQAIWQRAPDSPSVSENALAAIKYAFLKQNIGGDVVYDIEESISLEGQTGPYIQYAAVRITSILNKVEAESEWSDYDWLAETALLRLVAKYPEVVTLAVSELAPHRLAQYAYDLAKEFNRYYELTPVKDAPDNARSARVAILNSVSRIFSHLLHCMNIPRPDHM